MPVRSLKKGVYGKFSENRSIPTQGGLYDRSHHFMVMNRHFIQSRGLFHIQGTCPKPGMEQTGCQFAPGCEFAFDRCFKEAPELYNLGDGRSRRCFLYDKKEGDAAKDDESALGS